MNATLHPSQLAGFTLPMISRNLAIALSVVLLHVGFIYALYSGLLTRAVELVVPAVVLSQFIEPPAPKVAPPPPPPPSQVKKAATKAPTVAAPLPMENVTFWPPSGALATPVRTPEIVTLPPFAIYAGADTVIADAALAMLKLRLRSAAGS